MFNELFWMAAADAAQGAAETSSIGIWLSYLITLFISVGVGLWIVYSTKNVSFPHLYGLPFPNIDCMIRCNKTTLIFEQGPISVTLPMEQIIDMRIMKREHMKTQLVSDVGSAVGGAMDFGSWGAYAGGAPRMENYKTYSKLLFITYRKDDGEVERIVFDVLRNPSRAKSMINWCKKYYKQQKVKYTL